jgi:hypothetical protein
MLAFLVGLTFAKYKHDLLEFGSSGRKLKENIDESYLYLSNCCIVLCYDRLYGLLVP